MPQGLKVGGQFTLNPGSQEDSTFVAGLSNPMKDNDALDWVNDNEVTVFLKSVRNNASKGRVGLNEVMEVEKGIVIRELAFGLSEGFDNRVVGPESLWGTLGLHGETLGTLVAAPRKRLGSSVLAGISK